MDDIGFFRELLARAGDIALEYFLRVSASHKEDRTLITEADLAVQSFLIEAMEQRFPNDGLVAEEEEFRRAPRCGNRTWTIDPIDGTASFVAGLVDWSISIGLVEGGHPAAGYIWMPPSRDFFHTTPDGGVCRNGRRARLKLPVAPTRDSILFTHMQPHRRYTLAPEYPGRIYCLGSASVHLSMVATGGGDAVLIGHDKVWDLAPGLAMLANNGGVLRYLRGEGPVDLERLMPGQSAPHPMIGGHPVVLDHIEAWLDYHSPGFPWTNRYG